ncbi:MAG: DNA primase [Candidatus Omnitrophica bacterium]|nr:DNA primase [Candidatus Omnitrophota bacterium]
MGFIPQDLINQVIDRSDIVEVVASYVPLKKAGRNFKAACPFHHEKTPSFMVNPDKQIFHCFGCGVGGNAISFVMKQERLEFPETVRLLAEKLGIAIPEDTSYSPTNQGRMKIIELTNAAAEYFHQNLISDKSALTKTARDYLKQRGISLEIAQQLKLGFALDMWDGLMVHLRKKGAALNLLEKSGLIIARNKSDGFYDRFRNRIIFPIFDIKKRCIAFGARTLDVDNTAKYINSPETGIYIKGRHLYGFHLAKDAIGKMDEVIVVEGYMDFITPFRSGVINIVAALGTALTVDQIRLLRRYTNNVVLLFDSDQAGQDAMIRSFDLLIEEGMTVRVATLDKDEDPDSYIEKYGKDAFLERIKEARPLYNYKLDLLMKRFSGKGVESIAKISHEMLQTIDKFKNAVIKSEYIKNLAQTLSVLESALHVELKKVNRGAAARPVNRNVVRSNNNLDKAIPPVEKELLRLMLNDEEFISLTKNEIDASDFENIFVRDIVIKIFELFDQQKNEELKLKSLMNNFQDQKVLQFISSLVASKDALSGDRKKIHRDCIARLKKDQLRSRRRDIMNKMQQAKDNDDQQELARLTVDFNQLIKG